MALRLLRSLRQRRFAPLCLMFFSLTSCGGSSSTEARQALQAAASWAATAHMIGDAWMMNAAPQEYAEQTLLRVHQELQKRFYTFQSHSFSTPTAVRETLLEHLQSLKQTVGQMRIAVRQRDPSTLSQQPTPLETDQTTITSVLERSDVQA